MTIKVYFWTLDLQNLISRKIWVTWKFCNFHTVWGYYGLVDSKTCSLCSWSFIFFGNTNNLVRFWMKWSTLCFRASIWFCTLVPMLDWSKSEKKIHKKGCKYVAEAQIIFVTWCTHQIAFARNSICLPNFVEGLS